MARTYRVDFATLLTLDATPKRAILLRKALAFQCGYSSTAPLSRLKLDTADAVFEAISELTRERIGFIAPCGWEPADPSDETGGAVSLEAFCLEQVRAIRRLAATIDRQLKAKIAAHEYAEATDLAIEALFKLSRRSHRKVMPFLHQLADYGDMRAKLFLGRSLLSGEAGEVDVAMALRLLNEVTLDEDATNAGYAHMLLGEALMVESGQGYRAMRHFESAAYLGWEDGSEYAGVMNQLGANGVRKDLDRAARNFRYGARHGHVGCMGKLAIMILAGDTEYDPLWQSYFAQAMAHQDAVALTYCEAVDEACIAAGENEADVIRHFRSHFDPEGCDTIDIKDYRPVIAA